MPQHRVCIIEDETDIRETLCELLEQEGYSVTSAANGQEALGLLDGRDVPQLILLDLMMPVMNGWEFLKEAEQRGIAARIPIIVMSAATNTRLAQGAPVAAVVKKPIAVGPLLDLIAEHANQEG